MLPKPWDIVSSERRDRLRIFGLRVDCAVSPRTGKAHDFYVLESGSWVNVIPLTPAQEVVLIRQHRHGIREVTLEIPGGIVEPGDSPQEAARRELREETGLAVGRAEPLGIYWDRYFLKGFGWIPTMNFYHIARWRRGEPRAADDAASAEWVPFSRLGGRSARFAWKHMRPLLRDARRWAQG